METFAFNWTVVGTTLIKASTYAEAAKIFDERSTVRIVEDDCGDFTVDERGVIRNGDFVEMSEDELDAGCFLGDEDGDEDLADAFRSAAASP